jgi:hypothetical protein
MADRAEAAAHWDAYAQGEDTRSWSEKHPDMSLRVLGSAGSRPLMPSLTWAAAHPFSPGRCWIAASAT